jgi:phosphoribosylformylglycinamidine cyclo-ligase
VINTTWSGLYVPAAIAGELMAISESFGIEARLVGRCLVADQKKLTIASPCGTFEYR